MSEAYSLGAGLARLEPGRPLVIVDADEVVLRFVNGFDHYLRRQGLFLDLASYRLHGNVKRIGDHSAVLDVEVTALLEEFRGDLDWLEPVEGAHDALAALSTRAQIAVLSNIITAQAEPRARNLSALGIDCPLIANTGPKGPAVKHLADRVSAAAFFVDDIPQHLTSVAELAPQVFRIHLVGDEKLKPLLPPAKDAHFYAPDWRAARRFIEEHLDNEEPG
jgi:hypothetical protein